MFLTDGRVAIDNNPAERALRPIGIGRKNWLFAGADTGAETLALAMTVIETAKLNSLDPQAYPFDDSEVCQTRRRHDDFFPYAGDLLQSSRQLTWAERSHFLMGFILTYTPRLNQAYFYFAVDKYKWKKR